MKPAESKYKNTAKLMNQALLLLIEKKDFEFISIKEICEKAGVNRSTFYLHYENINDLLEETIEMLNNEFQSSFSFDSIFTNKNTDNTKNMVFIKPDFIIPYLEFIKRNKRIIKIIHNKPEIFKNDLVYKKMKKEVFYPALSKFQVNEKEKPYLLEFYTKGIVGIINQWIEFDCKDDINEITSLIIKYVGFNNKT